jgi:hypothetical protein
VRASRLGHHRRAHGILLFATVPMILGTYVLLNPHVVDRTHDAFRDLLGRYRQTRDGGFSSVYLREPGIPHLTSAVGAILTQFPCRNVWVSLTINAIGLWGIVKGVRKRDAVVCVSLAYAVCLVLSVSLPNRTFLFRNYIVIIPVISLAFGIGIVGLAHDLRSRLRPYGAIEAAAVPLVGVGLAAVVGLSSFDALAAQRHAKDPRVSAIDWISDQKRDGRALDVATTPSVFGSLVLGGYPELRDVMRRPSINFWSRELEACPDPVNGPQYVLDASYRDVQKAPKTDPWQELWFFRECPGYEQVASFDVNPYEINLRAYPTWPGRVSAIVLRRN